MSLMKRFVDSIGIREYLSTLELPDKGSNRSYDPVHIIESFWLSIWTGASRYIHADWLRYDTTLHAIFGWDKMPSQSTFSRFFGKFSQWRNTTVFPSLQHWFISQLQVNDITLDIDSTVITRSGNQEGSAKGYNPLKRGRNSHHPLMAFVSQTRMVANAWLRPGNTADSSSCKVFLQETIEDILAETRIGLICADSGFYTEEILSYIEQLKLNYIIVTRMYPNVKSEVYGIEDWIPICNGIDVSQMYSDILLYNHITKLLCRP
ncbi:MAG: transposase [Carboxylicivirga sp.]|jgi:hypothetical protein|nr:transposase [Carboxylicivirga sp.]